MDVWITVDACLLQHIVYNGHTYGTKALLPTLVYDRCAWLGLGQVIKAVA